MVLHTSQPAGISAIVESLSCQRKVKIEGKVRGRTAASVLHFPFAIALFSVAIIFRSSLAFLSQMLLPLPKHNSALRYLSLAPVKSDPPAANHASPHADFLSPSFL